MTMVPSICTASIVLRIASTATSSALWRSPNPMVRAAAMAPFSTTRKNSRLSCSSMHPPKSYVNLVGPLCRPPRLPPAVFRCCAAALGRQAMLDQTRLGVDTACVFSRIQLKSRRCDIMQAMKSQRFLLFWLVLLSTAARSPDKPRASHDWPVWGGQPENLHYSRLAQINRESVKHLAVAWSFDTGEPGGLQTSPIIVGDVLYGITPTQKIFALDAATGKLLWKFDSGIKGTQPDRGLAYWSSGKAKRILAGVMNFVYALDAATGKSIPTFGQNGRIDLRRDLGRDPEKQSIALTSPGVVYKDLIIVGGRNPETLPAPPGDVRAYDVRSGKLRWSFHTIPYDGEF